MKSLWIAGISALALVASPAHAGGESKRRYHDRPDYGPALGPDRGVYDLDGPGMPTWSGADGSRYDYQGDWTRGQYLDPEGRVYEGQWNGTVTRSGAAPYPPHAGAPYPPQAGAPYPAYPPYGRSGNYDRYERCLKSEGVAGGAIGAIIGGIAGNRIAGRGNRTGGSLIGAGLGALAGLGIEKAMKRCEKYLPDERAPGYSAPYPHGYPGHGGYHGHGAYPYGYYYYYPQPVVTYQMVPVTTTTVTEEVYYETVPVKRKAVRKWKPKPRARPRCVCR